MGFELEEKGDEDSTAANTSGENSGPMAPKAKGTSEVKGSGSTKSSKEFAAKDEKNQGKNDKDKQQRAAKQERTQKQREAAPKKHHARFVTHPPRLCRALFRDGRD